MKLVFSSVFEEDFAELVTLFAAESGNRTSQRFEEQIVYLAELLLRIRCWDVSGEI